MAADVRLLLRKMIRGELLTAELFRGAYVDERCGAHVEEHVVAEGSEVGTFGVGDLIV